MKIEISFLKKHIPKEYLDITLEAYAKYISENFQYKIEIKNYKCGLVYYNAKGYIFIGKKNNKISVTKGIGSMKNVFEKYKTFSCNELKPHFENQMKELSYKKALKYLI